MEKKKRTFGELKQGSYIWSAGIGCVKRESIISIDCSPGGNIDTEKVKVSIGYLKSLTAHIDRDATEFIDYNHHWFTDKNDARKCAYQMMIRKIRDTETEVSRLKFRARRFRENFLPDIEPQEEDWVLSRINRQVHEELERQKREGKEFLSEDEVDAIIKKVLAEKNF